jgi:hypothetical protein
LDAVGESATVSFAPRCPWVAHDDELVSSNSCEFDY